MKQLHQLLTQKSQAYSYWHADPAHTCIHFMILTIVAVSIFYAVNTSVATAHAETEPITMIPPIHREPTVSVPQPFLVTIDSPKPDQVFNGSSPVPIVVNARNVDTLKSIKIYADKHLVTICTSVTLCIGNWNIQNIAGFGNGVYTIKAVVEGASKSNSTTTETMIAVIK